MDAGNLLKPMLARGELHCIGATTLDEYRKHIEKDAALERRFQPVLVDQPSVEDTISILRGLKQRYESHHKVTHQGRGPGGGGGAVQPLHHRPLPAGQGHRPGGRGGGQAAHRDRLRCRRSWTRSAAQVMQLEIERESLKKEKDAASQERLAKLEKELADLKERGDDAAGAVAGGEGGRPAGSASCARQLEQTQQRAGAGHGAAATTNRAAELQVRRASRTWSGSCKAEEERLASRQGKPARQGGSGRGGHRRGRQPLDRHPGVASCSRARCRSCCTWRRNCTSASSARTRR